MATGHGGRSRSPWWCQARFEKRGGGCLSFLMERSGRREEEEEKKKMRRKKEWAGLNAQ